jgi:hypothetical protein
MTINLIAVLREPVISSVPCFKLIFDICRGVWDMKLIQEAVWNLSCIEDLCEHLGWLLGISRATWVSEIHFMYTESFPKKKKPFGWRIDRNRFREYAVLGGHRHWYLIPNLNTKILCCVTVTNLHTNCFKLAAKSTDISFEFWELIKMLL